MGPSESFPPPTGENPMNTGDMETVGIEPTQGSRHLDPAGLEAAAKALEKSSGDSEACDTGMGDCGGTHTDCWHRSRAADTIRAYIAAAGRAAATPDPLSLADLRKVVPAPAATPDPPTHLSQRDGMIWREGLAAATPDPPNAEAIDALREGLTVLDRGQTVLAADMIRHAIYRLEDAPAATPDPPDGARIVAWLRGLARSDEWAPGHGISQIADEIELRFATDVDYPPVASPDERLREAARVLVERSAAAVCQPGQFRDNVGEAQWRLSDAITATRAALAADREAPDEERAVTLLPGEPYIHNPESVNDPETDT